MICISGGERESSIEAVINWLLENPDNSANAEAVELQGAAEASILPSETGTALKMNP